MKFSCLRQEFLYGLNLAAKATSSANSAFPILETILINAKDNVLTLTGNTSEVAAVATLPGNVFQSGEIAVNAKIICEIIRRLSDDIVHFELTDNFNIQISCGESSFNIIGLSGEDFPTLPSVADANSFYINKELLFTLIKQTTFAVATNDIKPILTGVKFEIQTGNVTAVALDGYRLALCKYPFIYDGAAQNCVIPGRYLNDLYKMMSEIEDEEIKVSITNKFVLFQFDNCQFMTRTLDGEFMNYDPIIPKSFKIDVVVNTADFMHCIERVSLIAEFSQSEKAPIKLVLSDGKLTASCISGKGTVKDTLPIEGEVDEVIEMGINHRFLMDALRNIKEEKIRLQFNENINPVIITAPEKEDFLFLILPVRLRG